MSICYRFTSEHFQFWMLHIFVNSSLPVKFQFLCQLQFLLHSSSDGVNFDLLCQNPSWVDRHRVTAVALMQQMMSSSWGWHPDRDHRIQPGYPQWCSVKVKSPYLSSCSSVFVAAREKKIIELISILILPEVALYRSLDSQDQIRFCFPVYLKPSQKVSVISLAQDWIVLWRRSLLIEQHEWQFADQNQIVVPVLHFVDKPFGFCRWW